MAKGSNPDPNPDPNPDQEGELLKGGTVQVPVLTLFSYLCGWIYFFAWSLSFYPQCLLNYRKKSVRGLSLDYVILNITGFFCYSLYTLLLNYSPAFQEDYISIHGVEPQIEFNDVVFAVHGLVLCLITFLQCFIYERGDNEARLSVIALNVLIWTVIGVLIMLTALFGFENRYLILGLGLGKVTCSFIKYVPQVVLNIKHKSTDGLALHFVLLDLTGGIFSMVQQLLRSIQRGSLKPFTANIAKTGLAVETLLFDTIFLVQHFIIYPGAIGYSQQQSDTDENQQWLDWMNEDVDLSDEDNT